MKKNLYIGGYSILDLSDSNVYKQALICAEQNKPVLVYDDPERYFADTIKIDTDNNDNVVITKGGKTITINDANAVSSEGNIQVLPEIFNVGVSFKISGISYVMHVLTSNIEYTTTMTKDTLKSLVNLGDILFDDNTYIMGIVKSISGANVYIRSIQLTGSLIANEINLNNATDIAIVNFKKI